MIKKNRIIIHCDMNNYFASVEALYNPLLKNKPFVVVGDPALRHGIVLSKNNLAKEKGIITGESLTNAKIKCPNLEFVIADYKKYLKFTKLSRVIYSRYTSNDKIYPYGMDEAWLDITDKCCSFDEGIVLGLRIKKEIKDKLNLDISVGISFNYVFSKLASDKKSDTVYAIPYDTFKETTKNIPAFNLLFVGSRTRKILKEVGILTISDLANSNVSFLKQKLGKKGELIYQFANGDDSLFKPTTTDDKDIKSLGNSITSPINIKNYHDALEYLYVLSSIISKRLKKHNFKTNTVLISLKQSDFKTFTKQKTLATFTNEASDIFITSKELLEKNFDFSVYLRAIGLRVSKIIIDNTTQLSLFENNNDDLEKTIERLKKKFGDIKLDKSASQKEDFDI